MDIILGNELPAHNYLSELSLSSKNNLHNAVYSRPAESLNLARINDIHLDREENREHTCRVSSDGQRWTPDPSS